MGRSLGSGRNESGRGNKKGGKSRGEAGRRETKHNKAAGCVVRSDPGVRRGMVPDRRAEGEAGRPRFPRYIFHCGASTVLCCNFAEFVERGELSRKLQETMILVPFILN